MNFLIRCCLPLLTLWLSACGCRNVECAPCEITAPVPLRLHLDSLNGGFRRFEVRSTYLVRYADEALQSPTDTVRQDAQRGTMVYPNGSLDALFMADNRGGEARSYRLHLPAAARSYDLTEIDIHWEQGSGGCCSCPYISRRRFRLNGTYTVADGRAAPPTLVKR